MSDSPGPLRTSVAADLGSLAEAFAAPELPALAPGTIIGGHFVLEEALGRGGMGVVYRALDRELDRRVAIKIGLGGTDLARARREAIALARLAHPNVIAIHEIGEHLGVPFVAMELCEGGTARSWTRASPRTWREVLTVFLDAGRGLAAAHAAGLLHRDVKPDNILLGADGRARIADFGLARGTGAGTAADDATTAPVPAVSRDAVATIDALRARPPLPATANPSSPEAPLTATGALIGTPRYMAPEQLAGRPLDGRSDQFAFCIALYECLAGVDPFPAPPDARAVAMAAARFTPPGRERAVPRKVLAVVERGLAPAPGERFPTMDALLAALARAARPRWRTLLPAASALAVVAALAVAGFALTRDRAARVVVQAAPEATCASLPADLTPGWNGVARGAFISGNPAAGESAHWAAEVIDHQARVLASARAACQDVTARTDRAGVLARSGGPACLAGAASTIAEVLALRGQDPGQMTTAAGRVVEAAACAANLSTTAAAPDKIAPVRQQIADAERLASEGQFERALALAEEARLAARTDGGESIILRAEFTIGTILQQQARRAGPAPPVAFERIDVAPGTSTMAAIAVAATAVGAGDPVDPAAEPALVSLDGELHAFIRSARGTLLTTRLPRPRSGSLGTWSPLAPLVADGATAAERLAFDPAVLAADGRVEVFYRHPITGSLSHAIRRRTGWVVHDRGGLLARVATPVRTRSGPRILFFTPDPTLYHWFDQRLWFATTTSDGDDIEWGFVPEHVAVATRPSAVASVTSDRVDVVALDDRGHLSWHTRERGKLVPRFIWRPDQLPADVMFEDPQVIMTGDDAAGVALWVVVRATDGQLWLAHKPRASTSFGALTALGIRSDVKPAAVATGPGRFAVVGREDTTLFVLDARDAGDGRVLIERTRTTPALTGPLTGAVNALAGEGGIHVIAVASGGELRYGWFGR